VLKFEKKVRRQKVNTKFVNVFITVKQKHFTYDTPKYLAPPEYYLTSKMTNTVSYE
jgi:hypothetical protein